MPVVSVEVTDEVAKRFTPFSVVSTEDFKQEIYDDDDIYTRIVDFGSNGIGKEEFEAYLKRNA